MSGAFTYRHGIAVAQVIVFSPSLFLAVFLRYRHQDGWLGIGVFSVFRVVGAGLMLGTLTNDSRGVWTGVFVCESFGLSLILFLLLGFLHRANKTADTLHPRWIRLPQLLTWADMALVIAGFTAASKNPNPLAPTKYTQASYGIFTALFLILVYTAWRLWRCLGMLPLDERLFVRSVAVCIPLLAVRTAYSLVFQITGDVTWNAVLGNPTAYLLMTFLTEAVTIYISIWASLRVSPSPRGVEDKERRVGNEEQGYMMMGSVDGSSGSRVDRTRIQY